MKLCLCMVVSLALLAPAAAGEAPLRIPDEARMREIAAKVQALAGPGWDGALRAADHLWGWEGKPPVCVMEFRHRTLRLPEMGGGPASFHVSLVPWNQPGRYLDPGPDQPAPDVCLGWGWRSIAWFVGAETYGTARPQEWQRLIAALRKEFLIPEPVDGIQCFVDAPSQIIRAGEPLRLWWSVRNVSGKMLDIRRSREELLKRVRLLDAAGREVPCRAELDPRYAGQADPDRPLDPWQVWLKFVCLVGEGKPLAPGAYTVRADFPLGEGPARLAHSERLPVRVVPADFLAMEWAPDERPQVAADVKLPLSLSVNTTPLAGRPIRNLEISFTGSTKGRKIGLGSRVWGNVEDAERDDLRRQFDAAPPGKPTLALDLAQVHWSDPLSSVIQSTAFSHYVRPKERWDVTATLSGEVDGLIFVFESPVVSLVGK